MQMLGAMCALLKSLMIQKSFPARGPNDGISKISDSDSITTFYTVILYNLVAFSGIIMLNTSCNEYTAYF